MTILRELEVFGYAVSQYMILNACEQANVTGHVFTTGKIAYASQEPWIQSRSVRNNILFGVRCSACLDRVQYNGYVLSLQHWCIELTTICVCVCRACTTKKSISL
jgi:hypothetical protein